MFWSHNLIKQSSVILAVLTCSVTICNGQTDNDDATSCDPKPTLLKHCLFMREAPPSPGIGATCFYLDRKGRTDDVFLLSRNATPTRPNDREYRGILAMIRSLKLQRAECTFTADEHYCKGYNGDACTSEGDAITNTMFNECYLTDVWTNNQEAGSEPSKCHSLEKLSNVCILMKGWAAQPTFGAATCYVPGAVSQSGQISLSRNDNIDINQIQNIVNKANPLKVLRAECDFIGPRYYCTGYSNNYCDSQWDGPSESMFWDCKEQYHWVGAYKLDYQGLPLAISAQ